MTLPATGAWAPIRVLFFVNSTTLSTGDQALSDLMTTSGHVVTSRNASDDLPAGYATDYDLIVVSASISSNDHDSAINSATIPVILLEGFAADAGGTAAWISANPISNGSQTTVYYEDDTEMKWAGQTVDSQVSITSGTVYRLNGSVGAGWVTVVEQGFDGTGEAIVGVYPEGSTVYGGDTAQANYVYFGFGDGQYDTWNAAQEELFFSAIQWATGVRQVTVASTGADYTDIQTALDDAECENGIWRVIVNETAEFGPDELDLDTAVGTLDNTHFVHLCVHADHRHDGVAGTGHARLKRTGLGNGAHVARVELDHAVVSDLELKIETLGNSNEVIRVQAADVVLSRCILWSDLNTTANDQDAVYMGNWDASVSIDNCVIHGFQRAGVNLQQFSGGAAVVVHTVNVDHNTIINCGESGEAQGGNIAVNGNSATTTQTLNAYNNALANDITTDTDPIDRFNDSGTATVNGSHNAADDATPVTAATNLTDNTTSWQDASSGGLTETTTTASAIILTDIGAGAQGPGNDTIDCTPLAATGAGSNLLLENGTNRQGSEPDPRQDFSLDIRRATRPTTGVDIGAFQISTAGTPGDTDADAGLATATASAQAATATIAPTADQASAIAIALDPSVLINPNADIATAIADALDARGAIAPTAELATAAGTAYDAAVQTIVTALEQLRYRWFEDDGSESGATPAAAEDVPITAGTGITRRLRILIQTTGDVAAGQAALEFRRKGTIPWQEVTL